jgi:hypothetical protein
VEVAMIEASRFDVSEPREKQKEYNVNVPFH